MRLSEDAVIHLTGGLGHARRLRCRLECRHLWRQLFITLNNRTVHSADVVPRYELRTRALRPGDQGQYLLPSAGELSTVAIAFGSLILADRPINWALTNLGFALS